MKITDLSSLPYKDWITFVFDHPVSEPPQDNLWYNREGYDFIHTDPTVSVAYMTKLFEEMPQLLVRFNLSQLNQGIWFLFSAFPCINAIFDNEAPLNERVYCIESMFIPFANIVAHSNVESMENCFYMWWDLLSCPLHAAELPKDDPIYAAMLGTLDRILQLDDTRCQYYALHGLGHLRHSRCQEIIDSYICKHRSELTPEGLNWIQECRDGTVM